MLNSFRAHASIFSTLAVSTALMTAGCGGSGSAPPPGSPTMAVVGTQGGALSSSDGKLDVSVPAGALAANVTLTTEPASSPPAGAVGTVYEIGPSGTQFAMPVTMTLHYTAADLNGKAESSLRVATYANHAWQLLPGAVVDTQTKTVSGVTNHLSPYAIVTEATGKTCATVQANYGCSLGTGPNGGGATCDPPTCASANDICGQYPGATMDSCADGPKGYTASCCFAATAPICIGVGHAEGCTTGLGGGPSGTGGADGAGCPPPPTCATANAASACAGYPGATLQGCVDNPNGFSAGCCFAPDAPVCVSVSNARACAGSLGGGSSCSTPPPRCADANPCARYIGGSVQSCTDTADGFDATCCFPIGTLPAANPGSSGGGTDPGGAADAGTPTTDASAGGGKDAGGIGGTTGGGTGGVGAGGGTDPGTCGPGVACKAGERCGAGSSGGACMDCSCAADGHLTCVPCGKPDAGGVGGTTGGGTGGVGAGGGTDPSTCAPGMVCKAGERCGAGSSGGACMDCSCAADGHFTCVPCDKPDAGGVGGTTGGGTGGVGAGGGTDPSTCAPGMACKAGERCGAGSSGGACMDCSCAADGHFMCIPCDKPDAGGVGGTTGGGTGAGGGTDPSTCAPGMACKAGERCGAGGAGACMDCSCAADGHFTCIPCDKPDAGGAGGVSGGGTGTAGTGGGVTGPCQVMPMPAPDVGLPCSVNEICPDGSNYRVRCDGATNVCTCTAKGVMSPEMPTMSCSAFDPMAALTACGFPAGKI